MLWCRRCTRPQDGWPNVRESLPLQALAEAGAVADADPAMHLVRDSWQNIRSNPIRVLAIALVPAILIVFILLVQDPDQGTPAGVPTPTADAFDSGVFFLDIVDPVESEVFVETPSITVIGRTRADALVSVNDLILDPDANGQFEAVVPLEEGPNVIEVVASIATGAELDHVIAVIYAP